MKHQQLPYFLLFREDRVLRKASLKAKPSFRNHSFHSNHSIINNNNKERYSRQIALKHFGELAQQKLLQAKVLVIGAGGLGCPALQYLAAAGIGNIGIVDDDIVSLSNLHRQILYTTNDIGLPKAAKAAGALLALNPDITLNAYPIRLDTSNALELIKNYDIVIDGTDNFASRYLINDACVLLHKPLIYGSIYQFEGQVAVFNVVSERNIVSANYRDLFPQQPDNDEVPNCSEVGVIGVLPGIIGTMMANECIKLIAGIGNPLINKLLIYNTLTNQTFEMDIAPKEETIHLIPSNEEAFKNTQYSFSCEAVHSFEDVGIKDFLKLMKEEDTIVIDVREEGEKPIITSFEYVNVPMSILKQQKQDFSQKNILVFCHAGIRSVDAALYLSNGKNKVYNLKGGIIRWMSAL